jgi:hypothetical protein
MDMVLAHHLCTLFNLLIVQNFASVANSAWVIADLAKMLGVFLLLTLKSRLARADSGFWQTHSSS